MRKLRRCSCFNARSLPIPRRENRLPGPSVLLQHLRLSNRQASDYGDIVIRRRKDAASHSSYHVVYPNLIMSHEESRFSHSAVLKFRKFRQAAGASGTTLHRAPRHHKNFVAADPSFDSLRRRLIVQFPLLLGSHSFMALISVIDLPEETYCIIVHIHFAAASI